MTSICNASTARRILGSMVLLLSVSLAHSADAPPVRLVVTFAAGGSTDNVARQLAVSLHEVTGKQYIVDNKPGASGTIATQEVVRAKPDGQTLLFTTGGTVTNAALFKKLPYDTLKDLTPIAKLTEATGFLLIVPSHSPYKSLDDLIAAARAKPGTLSYGSAGIGNTTHLAGALFERAAGLKLIHVPYKANAINDLIGGQIDMLFWGSSFAAQQVATGKARALAVAGPRRMDELPDVPTLDQKGLKGVDVPAWSGVFAPSGMPADEVRRLASDIDKAMAKPAFIESVKASGGSIVSMTQPAFAAEIRSEVARFQRELPALGISMD